MDSASESGGFGQSTTANVGTAGGTLGGTAATDSAGTAGGSGGTAATSTSSATGDTAEPVETDTDPAFGEVSGASETETSAEGSDGSDAASTGTSTADASSSSGGISDTLASMTDSASDTDSDDASGSGSANGGSSSVANDNGSTSMDSDGSSDGALVPTFCLDGDGDGFGSPELCVEQDDPPDGYVPADNGADCNDASASTYPGAAENDDPSACMADEDGDGYGDRTPLVDDVTPGSDCDDTAPDLYRCALLVTDDGTSSQPYDEPLVDALQEMAFAVTIVEDVDATAIDAAGMEIVVISESALSTEVSGTFRDVVVPILCMEGYVWDELGMAPEGTSVAAFPIAIADEDSPLAAGLSGSVTVIDGVGAGLFETTAPAGAQIIASRVAVPDATIAFAFESGATMLDDFVAPARRVGLGLDADRQQPTSAVVTDEGRLLFEAAVAWLTDN